MRVRPAQPHQCVVCFRTIGRKGFQIEWNGVGWTCLRWRCLKAGYKESTPR